MKNVWAILHFILLLFLAAGCGSMGNSGRARTMEVTILVPANPEAYWATITGEQDFQKAAAMPFVRKRLVVPYSRDRVRASADAAASEMGMTQLGLGKIDYWKVENGTVYVLLNIDTDGWAGVMFSRARYHPIVEKTLLQFKSVKRVVWDGALGDQKVP